ncbi:MAG: BON domain-containing protein [Blastocatellales bacterium]|nr:BON domain-containing protein [Blastocatellales bacterium]
MNNRKRLTIIAVLVCLPVFATALALPVFADSPITVSASGRPPAGDAEIRQCIIERLASSPSLKDQGLSASVSGGAATLSGIAKNPGSKGAATNIAKKCGATSVVNNITISPDYKPAKKKM